MDTNIVWAAPTLLDALNKGEEFDFQTKQPVAGSEKKKYRCVCGSFKWPQLLIDIRGLPHITQDFACDGCWSDWKRNGIDIDGDGDIDKKDVQRFKKWRKRWMKALGAPKELLKNY